MPAALSFVPPQKPFDGYIRPKTESPLCNWSAAPPTTPEGGPRESEDHFDQRKRQETIFHPGGDRRSPEWQSTPAITIACAGRIALNKMSTAETGRCRGFAHQKTSTVALAMNPDLGKLGIESNRIRATNGQAAVQECSKPSFCCFCSIRFLTFWFFVFTYADIAHRRGALNEENADFIRPFVCHHRQRSRTTRNGLRQEVAAP